MKTLVVDAVAPEGLAYLREHGFEIDQLMKPALPLLYERVGDYEALVTRSGTAITPELHDALQAQCDRVRSTGRMNRVAEIEITATVTEAWQESGRDYVTAYIAGSIVDYTVDEASDRLVAGSKTVPRGVEEFWTFTRPAGLNFWMLSAIQTS